MLLYDGVEGTMFDMMARPNGGRLEALLLILTQEWRVHSRQQSSQGGGELQTHVLAAAADDGGLLVLRSAVERRTSRHFPISQVSLHSRTQPLHFATPPDLRPSTFPS